MEEIKDRLVQLAKESDRMHEIGVISIYERIQLDHKEWPKFSTGEKVKIQFRKTEPDYPFETSFQRCGVTFFAIWSIEEYLEVYPDA